MKRLNASPKRMDMKKMLNRYGVFLALILVCILLSFLTPAFMTSRNIINVVRQVSVYGLLAIGVMLVVITGEIDLSVGSIVALSGVTSALAVKAGAPWFVAIVLGMASGMAAGLFNGLFVTLGNVPSFIATLGMQGIARGVALLMTNGYPVSGLGDSFRFIGRGSIGFLPVPIIVLLICCFVMAFVAKRTDFGRHLFAIGGSRKAALYSGINVRREIIKAFVLSGFFSGLAGVVLTARLGAAETVAGEGFEQIAIAAVVIGGASLAGGKGNMLGTLVGTLIIGVINNGMTLLSIQTYWQKIVQGAIIVLAVLLNTMQFRSRRRSKKSASLKTEN